MRLIATIEGEPIRELDDKSVAYRAKAAVDTDGIGPLHGDPDAQRQTTLRYNGNYLNADEVAYVVVPPAIIRGVRGIVMGCQAYCVNSLTGKTVHAVVGDEGPPDKLGEVSVACAKLLGIDPSPTTGGEQQHRVHYLLYPGVPAYVNGVQYNLQSA